MKSSIVLFRIGIENGLGGLTTDNSAEYYWKFFKGALKEAPKIGPTRHDVSYELMRSVNYGKNENVRTIQVLF